MAHYNTNNEKTKKNYEEALALNERLSPASIHTKLMDIRKYEEVTAFADFKRFNADKAKLFKESYKKSGNAQGKQLDYATVGRTLRNVQEFFRWLSGQPIYRRHIRPEHLAIFNLSLKEENMARHKAYTHPPTLEQLKRVLLTMPAETELEKRNRAMLACLVLTGVRVAALISLKLKHVNIESGHIVQDGREVKTKFSKSILTQFFPVDKVFEHELACWVRHLREEKVCGLDAPLFPAVKGEYDAATGGFKLEQLSAEHITSTTTVRTIMQQAFENAGVPYFNPHSVRNTLVQLGQQLCKTPEEFKAWSQNLGHSSPLTTFTSYGEVHDYRQCEIIRKMGA